MAMSEDFALVVLSAVEQEAAVKSRRTVSVTHDDVREMERHCAVAVGELDAAAQALRNAGRIKAARAAVGAANELATTLRARLRGMLVEMDSRRSDA